MKRLKNQWKNIWKFIDLRSFNSDLVISLKDKLNRYIPDKNIVNISYFFISDACKRHNWSNDPFRDNVPIKV